MNMMTEFGHTIESRTRTFLETTHHRMLIGDQWVEAADGQRLEVINPADETVLGTVPAAQKADVDRAVRAAGQALENGPWGECGPPNARI